jgi:hypothetical protein
MHSRIGTSSFFLSSVPAVTAVRNAARLNYVLGLRIAEACSGSLQVREIMDKFEGGSDL